MPFSTIMSPRLRVLGILFSSSIVLAGAGAESWLEAQVALARAGFSSGPIDGVPGPQTQGALRAYQEREGIPVTGALDAVTRTHLTLDSPALTQVTVTDADLASLQPLSPTWLGKSQQSRLSFATILELVAERARASHRLVRSLNPEIDWEHVSAGTVVTVPSVPSVAVEGPIGEIHIHLGLRTLTARDHGGRVVIHFPVSIGREVAKRPVGELHVTVVIPNPDYTFDPAVFVESEEGRELGRRLILPPGPNNPVGVAWIGLNRPGYGIHGTPTPEQVGRTESHGCFRLANWDAETLLRLAWVGLPVLVEP
ncbi:MAG: murein L,D-transpeptidase [Opitutaceae bacterium]|nr:murein L,D-transpeptidase [Opitutaceae bacterium]